MKATSHSLANIALVKYWGKRDDDLILPHNGSISMCCRGFSTIATVDFDKKYTRDTLLVNGQKLKVDEKGALGQVRRIAGMAGIKDKARVSTVTNFPIAAGLASSSSGIASITVAAARAAGLDLSEKELTILARKCSGSACRSIPGGFVEWFKGEKKDGSDSFAVSIAPENHWPEFRMLFIIVSTEEKKVSSRAGMENVLSSPYYQGWLDSVEKDLADMRKGIKEKDFTLVGTTAERSAVKMHAIMMTQNPPVFYWQPQTIDIIQSILSWRESGLECYFTMDAGPNVKVMCLEKDEKTLARKLEKINGIEKIIPSKAGGGTKLIDNHLF